MREPGPLRSGWLRALAVSTALLLAVGLVSMVPVARVIGLRLSDSLFRVAPKNAGGSRVVVVLIDDESLQKYGRWPWPRQQLAQLVRNLKQAGAQAIGLDILLSEPESEADDQALAAALHDARAIIVDKIGAYPDGPRWIEPIPILSTAAGGVGHAQAVLDIDGVCRRFPPRELGINGERWAFAIELARRVDADRTQAFLADSDVAREETGRLVALRPQLVRVAYRRDGFDTISAARVLEGRAGDALRQRPVVVGFGPTEIADRVNTPLSGELPTQGVEVHAQVLDSILTGRTLRELPLWASLALVAMACVGAGIAVRRWVGWKAIVWMFSAGAVVYVCSVFTLTQGWLVPVAPMLFVIALAPVLAYASDFIVLERSLNRQLRELQHWLTLHGDDAGRVRGGLPWRLDVIRELQSRLGELYELYGTLMETTQSAMAVFDQDEKLLLSNRRLKEIREIDGASTLTELRESLQTQGDASVLKLEPGTETEVHIGTEPYAMRVSSLPATTLTPMGGTLVTLTSLKMREERDRARSEALGFVTHELRTPLTAIQGFAEIMMRYPGSPSSSRAPETIFRESKRLLALIHNYLDVLRLDAGARPIKQERVRLSDVVRETFEIVQPLADAAGVKLLHECESDICIVGDKALIGGALLNLVSNAIKYGRQGTDVTVRTDGTPDAVSISVHNQGEPIATNDLAHVFDPYFRAASNQERRPGWGLGLAFVKRIAEKHGGRVRATSGPAGTTFEVLLPAHQRSTVVGAA